MSLSVLLDYRLEDNKEHSFEVTQQCYLQLDLLVSFSFSCERLNCQVFGTWYGVQRNTQVFRYGMGFVKMFKDSIFKADGQKSDTPENSDMIKVSKMAPHGDFIIIMYIFNTCFKTSCHFSSLCAGIIICRTLQ